MNRNANRHSTWDKCLPVLPHPGLEHPEHEQHHQEGQGERGPDRLVRPGRPVTDLRQQSGLVLHLDLHNIGMFQEMICHVLNAVTGFDNLKVAKLAGCGLKRLYSNFSDSFPSLVELDLSNNKLNLNDAPNTTHFIGPPTV